MCALYVPEPEYHDSSRRVILQPHQSIILCAEWREARWDNVDYDWPFVMHGDIRSQEELINRIKMMLDTEPDINQSLGSIHKIRLAKPGEFPFVEVFVGSDLVWIQPDQYLVLKVKTNLPPGHDYTMYGSLQASFDVWLNYENDVIAELLKDRLIRSVRDIKSVEIGVENIDELRETLPDALELHLYNMLHHEGPTEI
jgi:hypothetical protein